MDLFESIKQMIVKILAVDEKDVVPEAHLQDDLGADSLAILSLVGEIATRFKIELQGDDVVELENVGALVKLVEARMWRSA